MRIARGKNSVHLNSVQMNILMLTERQQEVLDFVRTFQEAKGVPPSTREIQRHFNFASQTAVMGHLRSLARKGMIEQLADRVWGLKASEVQTHLFELPVYGTIPAGLPAMQEQEPVEKLPVSPTLFGLRRPKAGELWGLRVSGDSMVDAHILDGDLAILVRREPRAGDIIAALVDETTTTLKRLLYVRGKPILRPENKRYRDIVPEHRLEAQGVLVGLIRRQIR
jgi:repressor LexA